MGTRWKGRSKIIGRSRVQQILARDLWTCQYCGEAATGIDHIFEYFAPDNGDDNLVASCVRCNSHASNFWFWSFRDKRSYILNRRGILGRPLPEPMASRLSGRRKPPAARR